jgi:peptide/nickel transport system ATP-binding protein
MVKPVLAVEAVRVETDRGVEIVDDVSFDVRPGELLAVVGESGCGKTTAAMALLGHARAGTRIARGSVWLDGTDVLTLSGAELREMRGKRASYVAQDPGTSLNPRHRVGDQIAEIMRVHGVPRDQAASATRELLAQVQLPTERDFMRRFPFELSGGQQQRVMIAAALAMRPSVIVLDEPTTGLDVTTQRRILDVLSELREQLATAFVYVTHDLAVVDTIADRVLVMYAGRVVESGARREVLHRPAHPYTARLLDSVPRLAARRAIVGIAGTTPAPGERPPGCSFAPRCPLRIDRCTAELPPLEALGSGHGVRCWRSAEVAAMTRAADGALESPARASDQPVLGVEGLVASYGARRGRTEILHGVALSVSRGECVALVGESGSGKSTLGRCIAGLHSPDSGSIELDGRPLAPATAGRAREDLQRLQIIFQNPNRSLNPSERIGDALGRPLRQFHGLKGKAARRRAAELLERVRLPHAALDRFPRELSGGEKQRVAIARGLAAEPVLMICDEITSALDVSIQAAIVTLLDELRNDGLALLFITHNLALVNSIADRVLVLQAGEIRESGPTANVIGRPEHEYTRQLLAAAPELSVTE